MRLTFLALSLLLLVFVVNACDDSSGTRSERYSDSVEEQVDEFSRSADETAERLQKRLQRAQEELQEKLDALEDDDTVSREELERLRYRIRESAARAREEFVDKGDDFEVAMRDLGKALEKIGDALQEDSDVQPVDHRKLKDLLPREVAGMERYDTDGSTNSVLGIKTSKIQAKYEGASSEMSIEIVDLGSLSGAATVGLEFIDARVDHEYDHGYERTTRIDGFPAILKFDDSGRHKRYEAVIMVSERFVVEIKAKGSNLDDDVIDQVVDYLSFDRLERLAR